MRTGLAALFVFGIGLAAGLFGMGARAHATVTTLTGSVGSSSSPNAFVISLSETTVPAGTYTFDITDYASIHNFDLTDPDGNSVDKTPVDQSGTVTATWTVTLSPGTYTYHCDVHTSLKGTLVVTGPGTSTATSTSTTTPTTGTTATTGGSTTTGGMTTGATTTTGNGGGAALRVHIVSVHAKRTRVAVTVTANQLTRAVVVLMHKRKRLARGAADGRRMKVTLKPAHTLAPGSYVVRVTVSCCGTSARAKKTIRIR